MKSKEGMAQIFWYSSTLLGAIVAFNLYIHSLLGSSVFLENKLSSLKIYFNHFNVLIITISTLLLILTLAILYSLNKFVLDYIIGNRISSDKLLLAILISAIPGPLLGSILIDEFGVINKLYLNTIIAFIQPIIMLLLLRSEFRSKRAYISYAIILLAFAGLNTGLSALV